MAENMLGDIISDHRERMLNLKKYYPFFKLIDTSFASFKGGKYEILDMGYIVMAVLRFFRRIILRRRMSHTLNTLISCALF